MFDKIQQIIHPHTLSSFEFTKLEELSKIYPEEAIIKVYQNNGYKPIQYITKVLSNKKTITTSWINKVITNEPLDDDSDKTYKEFIEAVEDFRKWERF